MIDIPTVLILGAGASYHLGYPLGSGLISQICELGSPGKQHLPELPPYFNLEDVHSFITRLSRGGYSSIDACLEESGSEELMLGKYLIAHCLKQHEKEEKLFPPSNSGWYHYLFGRLFEGARDDWSGNNLTIITFNYDRSLEAYLHRVVQARLKLDSAAAWSIVNQLEIIHVHGILGKYPEVDYGPKANVDELYQLSQRIQIIHEVERDRIQSDSRFCSSEFEYANAALNAAKRIIFLGFGFHEDNIRRFEFFNELSVKEREVYASTTGLGTITLESMFKRLGKYGFSPKLMKCNSYQCSDFFQYVVSLD